MTLEIIERKAANPTAQPILFVHGILSAAWIWDAYFLGWFAKQGYHAYALSLRGHGKTPTGPLLDQIGLQDFVDDVRTAVLHIRQQTGQEPLLVGHSMGGMVVQRYLSAYRAPAAVIACSIPPQGALPLSIVSLWSDPFRAMRMAQVYSNPAQADAHFIRDILFHHPVSDENLRQWFRDTRRESMRLSWDLNTTWPLIDQIRKTPLAVLGSRYDRLVPRNVVDWTAITYHSPKYWLDAGHVFMLEQNWQDSAHILHNSLQTLLTKTAASAAV